MKIEINTKYNIGQEVFLIYNNKVENVKIDGISINAENTNTETKINITYHVHGRGTGFNTFSESVLFHSKQDLLNNL